MSDKEKLIELLDEAEEWALNKCDELECKTCPAYKMEGSCMRQLMVDHLISNGVTVQRWIPVSERLPSFKDAIQPTVDDDPSVLAVFKVDDRPRIYCIDVIRRHPEKFTYWMPLSEPPKECE